MRDLFARRGLLRANALFSALEEDYRRVVEEVVPEGRIFAPLGREAWRDPLDISQANRLQGLFVGASAQVIIVKSERAAILENRVTRRCFWPTATGQSSLPSRRRPC